MMKVKSREIEYPAYLWDGDVASIEGISPNVWVLQDDVLTVNDGYGNWVVAPVGAWIVDLSIANYGRQVLSVGDLATNYSNADPPLAT